MLLPSCNFCILLVQRILERGILSRVAILERSSVVLAFQCSIMLLVFTGKKDRKAALVDTISSNLDSFHQRRHNLGCAQLATIP